MNRDFLYFDSISLIIIDDHFFLFRGQIYIPNYKTGKGKGEEYLGRFLSKLTKNSKLGRFRMQERFWAAVNLRDYPWSLFYVVCQLYSSDSVP